MEPFRRNARLPGADEEWNMEVEIDWGTKEVNVHIDSIGSTLQPPGPRSTLRLWP